MLRFRKFPVAKSLWIRGGREVSRFSFESFLSDGAEKFRREPFSVSLISGVEKICASEGYVTIFLRIVFCLTVPKVSVGESFSLLLI